MSPNLIQFMLAVALFVAAEKVLERFTLTPLEDQ